MKKIAVLIMTLTLIISLGACADKPAQTPAPTPDPTIQPTPVPTPVSTETPAPSKENLKDVYQGLVAGELLPEGAELTEQIMDGFYEGLSDIELNQRVIYIPTFNVSATEIALIEVKDSEDVQAVVEILAKRQTDLDNLWKQYLPGQYELVKNAKIVQNGSFIMFVVAEHAEEVETAFNELF